MKTLFIAAMLLTAPLAQARLGETVTEIYNRYGPVESRQDIDSGWRATYTFKIYKVIVTFQNDKSVAEFLGHIDSSDFTDDEVHALMSGIATSTNWVKDAQSTFESACWRSKDNGDVAIYGTSIGSPQNVGVMTHAWWAEFCRDSQAEEKKKADGF